MAFDGKSNGLDWPAFSLFLVEASRGLMDSWKG
jgi:hypothetical protein